MLTHSSVSINAARFTHAMLHPSNGAALASTFEVRRLDTKSEHKNGAIVGRAFRFRPSHLVKRQAIAWDGMAARNRSGDEEREIEFRFLFAVSFARGL